MHYSNYPMRRVSAGSALIGASVALLLSGCVSEPAPRYSHRSPVQVVQPEVYIYYPAYEVYYNQTRGQYIYYDGRGWVAHREPPRRWARELRRSPWVRMEFNDAPERHHADVARRYPRSWSERRDRDDGRRGRDDRGR